MSVEDNLRAIFETLQPAARSDQEAPNRVS